MSELPVRIPISTFRLQLNAAFTFRDARDLASYLAALGISDCYMSPILAARRGSTLLFELLEGGGRAYPAFPSHIPGPGDIPARQSFLKLTIDEGGQP